MHEHDRLRRQADRLRKTARNPRIPEDGPMGRRELERQAAIFEAEAYAAEVEFNAQQRQQAAAARQAEDERIRQNLARANDHVQRELDRQAQARERHRQTQDARDPRNRP